jgi:two-component system, sporulation sensor kinase A
MVVRHKQTDRKKTKAKPRRLDVSGYDKPFIAPEMLMHTKGTSISLLSPDMTILWTNRYLEDIYGDLRGIAGQKCYKVYHNGTKICPDCVPAKAMRTKLIATGVIKRKAKDGTERFLQSVSVPFIGRNGKVTSILEILFDVTKGKLLEMGLKESEEFYRTLFEYSGTAIAVNDRQGIIRSVNKTFCDLAGFKKEEIEGKKHYLEFVLDKERVSKIHEKRWSSEGNSTAKYEYIFLTRDQEQRFIDISISKIPRTSLSIASMIDNTDKKNLEKDFREKEQFLANILRESADAIIVLDNSRIIKAWNKGAEQIFGYSSEEIIGNAFDALVPEDLIKDGELEILRSQILTKGFVRNYITDRIKKDGRRVTVAETATLIKDEKNNLVGRAIILRDITERIRLEQQLVQNEKMLAIGTLSASLAHEIKNPLNSIVINMEILRNMLHKAFVEKKDRPYEKYLAVINEEINRLDRVIKDFLSYAKPQSSSFKAININNIIRNTAEFIAQEAKKQEIEINLDLDKDIYEVHGEENQLKQIFLNLLLNSLQAMPDGGKILISSSNKPDGKVYVTLSDTGEGIKKEDRAKVFDLFFTTKAQGSGLGLPTVAQLIKNHGGQISFVSEYGKGSTFYITLPAA